MDGGAGVFDSSSVDACRNSLVLQSHASFQTDASGSSQAEIYGAFAPEKSFEIKVHSENNWRSSAIQLLLTIEGFRSRTH
jgi:hypothetical protein